MFTKIRVVSVGPAVTVRGGVSRLIEMVRLRSPDHIKVQLAATQTQYVGKNEPERGSYLVQGAVYSRALCRVLFSAIVFPRTVFHVYLSHGGSALRKGLICALLRALRARYVVHAESGYPELFPAGVPSPIRRLLLWGLGGGRYFIALTRFWCEHYGKMLKLPPSRVLLLPNPAEWPPSVPDRTSRGMLNLLFVGRVGQRKGAFDVIQAFRSLPDEVRRGCSLTLAGDGEIEAARELALELGCSEQTAVLGWVGTEEVVQLLARSDVLLLPSREEGLALTLVEAMSWGLAVVTTSVGGAGEFLESGHNCILVVPGDVPAIASAICELARSPGLRLRLGVEARRTAKRFSLESCLAKLATLYEELAGDLPAGARISASFCSTTTQEHM